MILSFCMGCVVPWLMLSTAVLFLNRQEPEETEESAPITMETTGKDMPVLVRVKDGTVEADSMEAYLVGVVLAEMPAYFEPEALKAQSVVARTYAGKAYATGGKHGDGSVCTDFSCCQAYISEEEYLDRGGTQQDVEKVSSAVLATAGCVLMYEGEWVEATYFSCSGGRTEDAVAVWGTDYPYLRSVESPGEEDAPPYTDMVRFSFQEFQDALDISLSEDPGDWFGMTTYTSGGGVAAMQIGGKTYAGTQLRSLLGLRSTLFSVRVTDSYIEITTKGYGHRVGMSQYGADAMAASGSTYQEILAWYYPGTELVFKE